MLAFRQNSYDFLYSSQICKQYHLIIYRQLCTCIYSAFFKESLCFYNGGSTIVLSVSLFRRHLVKSIRLTANSNHNSCTVIFHGRSYSLILILKKQPPDTILISDSCFSLLYFISQLLCCHVTFCLNFTVFAALPLLVCSFDSAKVKLI